VSLISPWLRDPRLLEFTTQKQCTGGGCDRRQCDDRSKESRGHDGVYGTRYSKREAKSKENNSILVEGKHGRGRNWHGR